LGEEAIRIARNHVKTMITLHFINTTPAGTYLDNRLSGNR
jgi:hypothetical protein